MRVTTKSVDVALFCSDRNEVSAIPKSIIRRYMIPTSTPSANTHNRLKKGGASVGSLPTIEGIVLQDND